MQLFKGPMSINRFEGSFSGGLESRARLRACVQDVGLNNLKGFWLLAGRSSQVFAGGRLCWAFLCDFCQETNRPPGKTHQRPQGCGRSPGLGVCVCVCPRAELPALARILPQRIQAGNSTSVPVDTASSPPLFF